MICSNRHCSNEFDAFPHKKYCCRSCGRRQNYADKAGGDVQPVDLTTPKGLLSDEGFYLETGYPSHAKHEKRFLNVQDLNVAIKKKRIPVEKHRVRTIAGTTERKFARIEVLADGEYMPVLANITTGALFSVKTGQCYSGNPKIVGLNAAT